MKKAIIFLIFIILLSCSSDFERGRKVELAYHPVIDEVTGKYLGTATFCNHTADFCRTSREVIISITREGKNKLGYQIGSKTKTIYDFNDSSGEFEIFSESYDVHTQQTISCESRLWFSSPVLQSTS